MAFDIEFIAGDTVDVSIALNTKSGPQNVAAITSASLRAKNRDTGSLVSLPLVVRPGTPPGDLQLALTPSASAAVEGGTYDFQIHCVFTGGVEKTWRSADKPAGTLKVVPALV